MKTIWCISTNKISEQTMYLGWQHPAWDEDGYFWTLEDVIPEMLINNTPEHPFLFGSREEAIRHLKSLNLPQKCRVVKWQPVDERNVIS